MSLNKNNKCLFIYGIWALCASWVTSSQFHYSPCLTCWALFGSCAQVHELPWGHWRIGNNREGTLSVFFTTYIYIYIYIYVYIYILRSSYFCANWLFCVSWVTSKQFYYAPCFTCWVLFGLLVPLVCNRTSCAQLHELPWSHWRIGNNRVGTLSF